MTEAQVGRSPLVLWRRATDRTLVLSGGQVHQLLGLSAFVWDLLAEPKSPRELSFELAKVGLPAAFPLAEVESLVQTLLALEVVIKL